MDSAWDSDADDESDVFARGVQKQSLVTSQFDRRLAALEATLGNSSKTAQQSAKKDVESLITDLSSLAQEGHEQKLTDLEGVWGRALSLVMRYTRQSVEGKASRSVRGTTEITKETPLSKLVKAALSAEACQDDLPVFANKEILDLYDLCAGMLEQRVLAIEKINDIIGGLLRSKLYCELSVSVSGGRRSCAERLLDCYMVFLEESDTGLSCLHEVSSTMLLLMRKVASRYLNSNSRQIFQDKFLGMLQDVKLDGATTTTFQNIAAALVHYSALLAARSTVDFAYIANALSAALVKLLQNIVHQAVDVDVASQKYAQRSSLCREITQFFRIVFLVQRVTPTVFPSGDKVHDYLKELRNFLLENRDSIALLAEREEGRRDAGYSWSLITWAKLEAICLMSPSKLSHEDAAPAHKRSRLNSQTFWGKVNANLIQPIELTRAAPANIDCKVHWLQVVSVVCDCGETWFLGDGKSVSNALAVLTKSTQHSMNEFGNLLELLESFLSDKNATVEARRLWLPWIARALRGMLELFNGPTPDLMPKWEKAARSCLRCLARMSAPPAALYTLAAEFFAANVVVSYNVHSILHERRRQTPGYLHFLTACFGTAGGTAFIKGTSGRGESISDRVIDWISTPPRSAAQRNEYVKGDAWQRANVLILVVQHGVSIKLPEFSDGLVAETSTDEVECAIRSTMNYVSGLIGANPGSTNEMPQRTLFGKRRVDPARVSFMLRKLQGVSSNLFLAPEDVDSKTREDTEILTEFREAAFFIAFASRVLCLFNNDDVEETNDMPSTISDDINSIDGDRETLRTTVDQLHGLVIRVTDEIIRWCSNDSDNNTLKIFFDESNAAGFLSALASASSIFSIDAKPQQWRTAIEWETSLNADRGAESGALFKSITTHICDEHQASFLKFISERPFARLARCIGMSRGGADPQGLIFVLNDMKDKDRGGAKSALTHPSLVSSTTKGLAIMNCLDTIHHWRVAMRLTKGDSSWADDALLCVFDLEPAHDLPLPALYVTLAAAISVNYVASLDKHDMHNNVAASGVLAVDVKLAIASLECFQDLFEDRHFSAHVSSVDCIALHFLDGLLAVAVREFQMISNSTIESDGLVSHFLQIDDDVQSKRHSTNFDHVLRFSPDVRRLLFKTLWRVMDLDRMRGRNPNASISQVLRCLVNDPDPITATYAAREIAKTPAASSSESWLKTFVLPVVNDFIRSGIEGKSQKGQLQKWFSQLLILKEILLCNRENEMIQKKVLKIFVRRCEFNSSYDPLHHVAASCIKDIAQALGFTSVRNFLVPYMPYLLSKWYQNHLNQPVDFPFWILSDGQHSEFLEEKYAQERPCSHLAVEVSVLVYMLIFSDRIETYKSIMNRKYRQSNAAKLSAAMPSIKAMLYSLEVARGVDERMSKCYKLLQIPPLASRSRDEHSHLGEFSLVALEVVRLSYTPHFEHDSDVKMLTVDEAIETLKKLQPSADNVLFQSRGAVKIVMGIAQDAAARIQLKDQRVIVEVFNKVVFSLLNLEHRVGIGSLGYQRHYFVSQCIGFWIRFLESCYQDETIVGMCIGAIRKLCYATLQKCPDALVPVVRNLCRALQNYSIASQDSRRRSIHAITAIEVQELILNGLAKQNLTGVIRFLDDVSDIFPDLKSLHSLYCTQLSPASEIDRFLKMIDGPLSERNLPTSASLSRLKNSLNIIRNSATVPDQIQAELVMRLMEICQFDRAAEDVKILASQCVGIVGPIQFSAAINIWKEGNKLPRCYTNSVQKRDDMILNHLAVALGDSSAEVIAAAVNSLSQIYDTNPEELGEALNSTNVPSIFEAFSHYRESDFDCQSCIYDTIAAAATEIIESPSFWQDFSSGHDQWIVQLVCTMIVSGKDIQEDSDNPRPVGVADKMLWAVLPLCRQQSSFCEMIFPYTIASVLMQELHTSTSFWRDHLQSRITSIIDAAVQSNSTVPAQTVVTLINSLAVLGTFKIKKQRGRRTQQIDLRAHLGVNNLVVAEAALKYLGPCVALYYIELWWHSQRSSVTLSERLEKCQSLLVSAARSTGEPDGIYGMNNVIDLKLRAATYEHEKQWGKSLTLYDFAARANRDGSIDTGSCATGICRALAGLGTELVCETFARITTTAMPQSNRAEVTTHMTNSAWRQTIWGSLESLTPNPFLNCSGFDSAVVNILRSLRDLDLIQCREHIRIAQLDVSSEVSNSSTASHLDSIYAAVRNYSSLVEATELLDIISKAIGTADDRRAETPTNLNLDAELSQLLAVWWDRYNQIGCPSNVMEPIVACRAALFRVASLHVYYVTDPERISRYNRVQLDCLAHFAELGRTGNRPYNSAAAAEGMKSLSQLVDDQCYEWILETARHFWASGESVPAMKATQDLIQTLCDANLSNTLLYHRASLVLSKWLAETSAERPAVIIDHHLIPAIEGMSQFDADLTGTELADAHLLVAQYADEQYRGALNLSCTIQASVLNYEKQLKGLRDPNELNGSQKNRSSLKKTKMDQEAMRLKKSIIFLEKRLKYEIEERDRIGQDMDHYIDLAMKHYLKCLSMCDDHDLKIFRVCSLWFANTKAEGVNANIRDNPQAMYKWVPLIHQLAARLHKMSSGQSGFKRMLLELVEKVSLEHPHHCLLVLIALQENAGNGQGENRSTNAVDIVLDKMTRASTAHGRLISATNTLVKVYSKLASAATDSSSGQHRFSSLNPLAAATSQRRGKIDGVQDVAVFTKEQPIRRVHAVSSKLGYSGLVTISSFKDQVDVAQSGLSKPKIVVCRGSDGCEYKELVKGGDDTKLDAVMQQVFRTANAWLRRDEQARKRNLKIGTYKVVPLSPLTGVLEWCSGTIPLAKYLLSAHTLYRPEDMTVNEALRAIRVDKKRQPPRSAQQRLEDYRTVCNRFKPVFRKFFTEYFPDPNEWFERRLAYTRSVSTTSIIGYVLGIGDRHVNNILVNQTTGELIHIDFGVAFDQGKVMPTPELVPFRLTRDIVDGMGVAGVEGVFRLSCEETMKVMRGSQVSLAMILEVFLDDPLYDWRLSHEQMLKRQTEENEVGTMGTHPGAALGSGRTTPTPDDGSLMITRSSHTLDGEQTDNSRAGEALRVLRETIRKLDGSHDESRLSVAGHVNSLIQKATDERNLALIFHGWQPYL